MTEEKKDDCNCHLDYENKCDCSDDDNCGCTFPNNCGMDFDCECSDKTDCNSMLGKDCCCDSEEEEEEEFKDGDSEIVECDTINCRSLNCDNINTSAINNGSEEEGFDFADDCECSSILVRSFAPNFIAPAVLTDNNIEPDFNLYEYLGDSYGLIFFYPNDFTYVCPSEIIAHNNRFAEFEKRNVKIVGISVDSVYAHLAWKKMPVNEGGIGDLRFPLVSDMTKEISLDYGILTDDGTALRATFILDREGIVRHQIVNDMAIGRNVDESLRIIDALQYSEKNGNVCPAGWRQGDEGLVTNFDAVKDFLRKNARSL